MFTAAVIACFLAIIYSRVALDRTAFVLQEIETASLAEETRYWQLRLEVAELESPDRVIRAAEGMGMVYPEGRRTLHVSGMSPEAPDIDQGWIELKTLLSAQP